MITDENSPPNFRDYLAARAMAAVTGSTGATFNTTTYVRAEDTHTLAECDPPADTGEPCTRCRDAFRRKYGNPRRQQAGGVVNQVNGTVNGSVFMAGDIEGDVHL